MKWGENNEITTIFMKGFLLWQDFQEQNQKL